MASVQQLAGQSGMQSLAGLSPIQTSAQPMMRQVNEGPKKSWWDKFKQGAFGQQEAFFQSPTVTPEQMNVLEQLLSGGLQGLQNPYQGFEPIEQKARSGFAQQTVPGLAERFTSLGSHGAGALSSPAFASELGQAGAGLEESLAAMRSQYGLQNRGLLLDQLKLGLRPAFETMHRPGTSGAVGEAWNTGKQASMQLLKILPFLL